MPTTQRVLRTKATGLRLLGTVGHYASCPDSAALSITGDLDVRCRVALTDWTPGALSTLVSKYEAAGQLSWRFEVLTSGALRIHLSADGTAVTAAAASSESAPFGNGVAGWVRVTWRASDGRVQYFTHADQATPPAAAAYTQLGIDSAAVIVSIFDSTSGVEVGTRAIGASTPTAGRFYYVEVRDGLDGTVVASPTFSALKQHTRVFADGHTNAWTVRGGAAVL